VQLYWGSGVVDDVPALSWFLVEALVPLALGMTAAATILLGDAARAQAVAEKAAKALPGGVGDELVQLILRTRQDSPLLLALAIAGMLWTSAGAVGVVERSLSRQLRRERFSPVRGKCRHILLATGVVIVIVLMVLAASKATTLESRIGIRGKPALWLFSLASVAVTVIICAGLYRFAPRGRLSSRAAVTGAVPAALGLQVMPTLVAYYLGLVAGKTPVRIFLLLAGVLFMCYIAAFSLLIGAAIAARRERSNETLRLARS